MSNFALTTDGRSTRDVEIGLQRYLPGLDVRLTPYSATQAILREHVVNAFRITYPDAIARQLVQTLGVVDIRPVSDDVTLNLIESRDAAQLAPRPTPAVVASAPGYDWHLGTVRAPAAWRRLGGPDSIAWRDVKVGHIDTGYTEHPALGFPGGSWIDVANARTFAPPIPAGDGDMHWPEASQPGQDNLAGISGGHGTRMAATICGWAPSAGRGAYYGVAPRVPLIPTRITDTVLINHAQRQFGEAMKHLVLTAGAKVSTSAWASRSAAPSRR